MVSDGLLKDLGDICSAETVTPGGSQTQQFNECTDNEYRLNGSTAAGAASVTMSWTLTGSASWMQIGVDVHASGAVLGGSKRRKLEVMDQP
jgi:hypothetical protein